MELELVHILDTLVVAPVRITVCRYLVARRRHGVSCAPRGGKFVHCSGPHSLITVHVVKLVSSASSGADRMSL